MAYYRVCPNCGGNLDPGEKCDCEREETKRRGYLSSHLIMEKGTKQLEFVFDSKEAEHEKQIFV